MSDAPKRQLLHAKVKSVLSGDTLVLTSLESSQERLFNLAFVSAPKLQRDNEEVRKLVTSSHCHCDVIILLRKQLLS